ncbi:unnamed protein product [Calicophoron daubneyi]|uniref:Uncharacterized protein n=1 Tax=Calicophoron daubneyi TaxID=300641 RepID=A0AAV2TS86_CALDB
MTSTEFISRQLDHPQKLKKIIVEYGRRNRLVPTVCDIWSVVDKIFLDAFHDGQLTLSAEQLSTVTAGLECINGILTSDFASEVLMSRRSGSALLRLEKLLSSMNTPSDHQRPLCLELDRTEHTSFPAKTKGASAGRDHGASVSRTHSESENSLHQQDEGAVASSQRFCLFRPLTDPENAQLLDNLDLPQAPDCAPPAKKSKKKAMLPKRPA